MAIEGVDTLPRCHVKYLDGMVTTVESGMMKQSARVHNVDGALPPTMDNDPSTQPRTVCLQADFHHD